MPPKKNGVIGFLSLLYHEIRIYIILCLLCLCVYDKCCIAIVTLYIIRCNKIMGHCRSHTIIILCTCPVKCSYRSDPPPLLKFLDPPLSPIYLSKSFINSIRTRCLKNVHLSFFLFFFQGSHTLSDVGRYSSKGMHYYQCTRKI